MMSLQTNNRIVHVMTAKLSVAFNSDITRQIKKAFFQAHLHSLKNRTRNIILIFKKVSCICSKMLEYILLL